MTRTGRLFLFWDYELQRGAEVARSGANDWGRADFEQTRVLLELLQRYGVRATFAVVGFAACEGDLPYHAADQVREMADRGHEIASHSWMHEWVPGLRYRQLLDVLARSKAVLERASDTEVVSFAPPWNAPTRFLGRTALGVYDWRGGLPRIDIPKMCKALMETGYKTARITYEPFHHWISRHLLRRIIREPTSAEYVGGIYCLKVNGSGFADRSIQVVRRAAESRMDAVIFAHPHSLAADNHQGLHHFEPFMEAVKQLVEDGKLIVTTPGAALDAGI